MTSGPDPERWQRVKRILDEALDLDPDRRAAFLEARLRGRCALASRSAVSRRGRRGSVELRGSARIRGRGCPRGFPTAIACGRSDRRLRGPRGARARRDGNGLPRAPRRRGVREAGRAQGDPTRHGRRARRQALPRRAPDLGLARSSQHRAAPGRRDDRATASPTSSWSSSKARPSLDYCDRHGLSVEERLRLFRRGLRRGPARAPSTSSCIGTSSRATSWSPTEGVPKLLDFGIAKLLSPEGALEPADQTGTVTRVLTPDYASPEQVRGQPDHDGERRLLARRRALRASLGAAAVSPDGHGPGRDCSASSASTIPRSRARRRRGRELGHDIHRFRRDAGSASRRAARARAEGSRETSTPSCSRLSARSRSGDTPRSNSSPTTSGGICRVGRCSRDGARRPTGRENSCDVTGCFSRPRCSCWPHWRAASSRRCARRGTLGRPRPGRSADSTTCGSSPTRSSSSSRKRSGIYRARHPRAPSSSVGH